MKRATTIRNDLKASWYKVGMVWLMIGLPLSVVIASMATLVIAHQNAPTLINKQVNTHAQDQ